MLPVPVPTTIITTPILSGATRPQCATPSLHTPHPLHLQGETPEIARLSPRACPPLARAIHQTMPRGLNQPPSPSLCDATSPRSQPPPACRGINPHQNPDCTHNLHKQLPKSSQNAGPRATDRSVVHFWRTCCPKFILDCEKSSKMFYVYLALPTSTPDGFSSTFICSYSLWTVPAFRPQGLKN
jgi:hypothetical protein